MDDIILSQTHSTNFLKEVEAESGQKISSCYQCGNCTAGCPAAFTYDMQVHQIMRGVQLGLRERVLASESVWMCLSCATCSLRCPNNIDVAAVMESLRHRARREGRITVPRVDKFWRSFLDTVRACGRTYELGVMVLYMLRSGRVFTDVDLAPQALLKRKLGFMPHGIKGAAAVGGILERYRKRCERQGVKS